MATEIAIFQLKDGKAPEDANSAAGQVLKDTLNTLTEQKGFQRAYWGTETENRGTFRLFVDWDSVDAHTEFTKTDTYKPFLERFGQIADLKSAQLFHSQFTPHPPSEALSDHVSPTTEIGVVYFGSDFTEHDGFAETYKQQVANIEKTAKAYTASAGGWIEEDIPIPGTSEKGNAYIGLIGWHSMEAHMEWRATPSHDYNIKLAEKYKDQIKHSSITHFSGTQVQNGAGGVGNVTADTQEEILNPHDTGESAPKTRADGTTTKNNDDLKGLRIDSRRKGLVGDLNLVHS